MATIIKLLGNPALQDLGQRAARAWLLDLAAKYRTTLTGLARQAHLNPATLTRPLEQPPKGLLTAETIQSVARALGDAPPAGLVDSLPPGRKRNARRETVAAMATMGGPTQGPNDVPVWGAVGCRRAGMFHLNRVAIDFERRPPGALSLSRVFCLRMPDDTMSPWRVVGERLYVDSHRPIGLADHALVEVGETAHPNDPPLAFVAQHTRDGWYQHAAREIVSMEGLYLMERFRILEWSEVL